MLNSIHQKKSTIKTFILSFKIFILILSTFVFSNINAQTITGIDDALISLNSDQSINIRGTNLQKLRLINGNDTIITQTYNNIYYNIATNDSVYSFPIPTGLQNKVYQVKGIGFNNQSSVQFNLLRFYNAKTSLFLEAWGDNSNGQLNFPSNLPLDRIVEIYLQRRSVIALLDDGSLQAWGDNSVGQLNFPLGLKNIVALAPGVDHCLALTQNGSTLAWGNNGSNQSSVPSAARSNVISIAAGEFSSLAILSNGQLLLWGDNTYTETTPPSNINQPFIQAAIAKFQGYGLLRDSTLAYWGNNINIFSLTPPPNTVSKLSSIYTGIHHVVGQKPDGSLVAWGDNSDGQLNIPVTAQNPFSYVVGNLHNVVITANKNLVTWGNNSFGQNTSNFFRRDVFEIYGQGGHANFNYIFRKIQIALIINSELGNIEKFYSFNRNDDANIDLTNDVNGYIIDSVFVDSVYNANLSTNFNPSFAYTNLTRDHVIRIRTRNLKYTLQTSAIPANGGTISAGNSNVNYFTPVRVTYTPNSGFQVYGVFVNGQAISLDSLNGYTFSKINTNLTVTVYFVPATSNGLVQVRTLTHNIIENDSIKIYGKNIDTINVKINNQWVNLNFKKTALSLDTLYTVALPANSIQNYQLYPLQLKNKLGQASPTNFLIRTYSVNSSYYWKGGGKNTLNQAQITTTDANSFLLVRPGPVYSVAIKPDYTISQIGQSIIGVPSNLPTVPAILDVFLGNNYGLMLRGNGTIAGWGTDTLVKSIPASLTNAATANVVFITANSKTVLALKADGSIVGWGDSANGILNIPNVVGAKAIAINELNGFYINSQDSLLKWGTGNDLNYPQPSVPTPLDLDSIRQVSASNNRVLAIKQNGTLLAWGSNNLGQSSPPINIGLVKSAGTSSNFNDNVFFDLALSNTNQVQAWGNYTFNNTDFNNVQYLSQSPLSSTFFLLKNIQISTQAGSGGSFVPVTNVPYNSNYTVSFSSIIGYSIDSVFINGIFKYKINRAGTNTYTFNKITGDSAIKVTFAPFTSSVSTSALNGTISSNSSIATYSGSIILTLNPNTGYELDSLFINGIYIPSAKDSNNRFTVNNILENIQAYAKFKLKSYSITTTILNATIAPSTLALYNSSLTITWTRSSNPNYILDSVIVDGVYQAGYANSNLTSYTFNNITNNHTIRVTYHPKLYTITTQVVNGFISPSTTVDYSSTYRVTYAQAGLNFVLSKVYINGVANPNLAIDSISRYIFSNLTKNVTIRVEYSYLSSGSPFYILRNKFFDFGTTLTVTGRNITEIHLVDFKDSTIVYSRNNNTLNYIVYANQNNTTDTNYYFTLPNRSFSIRPGVFQLYAKGYNNNTTPLQLIRLMEPGISKAAYYSINGPAVPNYIKDAALLAPAQYDNSSFNGPSKYGFALQTDGNVIGWSNNGSPLSLSSSFSNDIVDISFGNGTENWVRGAWGIALRSDGTVGYWTSNDDAVFNNQFANLGSLSNIVAIKAGLAIAYFINANGDVLTTGNASGAPYNDVTTNKPANGLRTNLISANYFGFMRLDSGESIYMPAGGFNTLFFTNPQSDFGTSISYTFPDNSTYNYKNAIYFSNVFFGANRVYGQNGYNDVGFVRWPLSNFNISKFGTPYTYNSAINLLNSYDLNTSLASSNSFLTPAKSYTNNARATTSNKAVDIAAGFGHYAILLDNGSVTLGGLNFLVPSSASNNIINRPSYQFNNPTNTNNNNSIYEIASTWGTVLVRNRNKSLGLIPIYDRRTTNNIILPTRNDSILGVFANGIVDHYYYAQKLRVSVISNLNVGGISITPTTNINARTNFRVTYSHPGYRIVSIVINGVTYNNLQDSNSGYTFYNIQSDISFNINFAPIQYNIHVDVNNGNLTSPADFVYVTGNSTSAVTFSPRSSTDTLVGIYINGVYSSDLTNFVNQNNIYSFQINNIVSNTNYRIVFNPKYQPIILQNPLSKSVLYVGDTLIIHGANIQKILLSFNNINFDTISSNQITKYGTTYNDSFYRFIIPNLKDQIYTVYAQNYFGNSAIAGIVKVLASRDILSIATVVPLNIANPFIPFNNKIVDLANGEKHTLALLNDGTILAWGDNAYGQSNVPSAAINANIVAVAAGNGVSVILKNDGSVYAWGNNSYGQLGINGLTNVKRISCGQDFIAALHNTNGTVEVFGNNNYGILNLLNSLPTFTEISAGRFHACGLGIDSVLTCWGNNAFTQTYIYPPLTKVISQSSGDINNLAILPNQTIFSWGDNSNNQLNFNSSQKLSAVYGGRGHATYKLLDNSIIMLGKDFNNNDLNLTTPLPINVYSVADGPLSQIVYILYKNLKLINTSANELGSISPSTTVDNNQNYRVTYQPVPGAVIDSIFINNYYDSIATKDSLIGYTFKNISTNVSIRVQFKFLQLQINTQVTNGTITPSTNVNYLANLNVTFSSNIGYALSTLYIDGVLSNPTSTNTYSFNNINRNHTVSVVNSPIISSINTSVVNGTITATTTTSYFSPIRIQYVPNQGAKLSAIFINGLYDSAATKDSTNGYTFSNVLNNQYIDVRFVPITYTITSSVNNENLGIISPLGDTAVNVGSNAVFNFSPYANNKLDSVLVNGQKQNNIVNNSYQINNITANATIRAFFSNINKPSAPQNVKATGGNSQIQVNFNPPANNGGSAILNYQIKTYYIDIDGLGNRVDSLVKIDTVLQTPALIKTLNLDGYYKVVIRAINSAGLGDSAFSDSANVNKIYINFNTQAINGTISQLQNVVANIPLDINFSANTGYQLDSFIINGVANNVSVSPYTYIPTANTSIIVKFKPIKYNVTTSVNNNNFGSISVTSPQFDITTTDTITVNANFGYKITSVVTNNSENILISSPILNFYTYSFTNINSNQSITATFDTITSTIKTSTNGNGTITPTVLNANIINPTTINFTPNNGYILDSLVVNGRLILNSANVSSYTFNSLNGNTDSIYVSFKINNIFISTSALNGAITPSFSANSGENMVTYLPVNGYTLDSIFINGVYNQSITQNNPSAYSFLNPASSQSIYVKFKLQVSTITPVINEGATISAPYTTTYYDVSQVTYSLFAGYVVDSIFINGVYNTTASSSLSNIITLRNISQNTTVYVKTRLITRSIIGRISGGGNFTANYKDTITIRNLNYYSAPYRLAYVPLLSSGNRVDSVLVDGILYNDSTDGFTFSDFSINHNIYIKFIPSTFSITTSVVGGIISRDTVVNRHSTVTVTYQPNSATYLIDSIYIDGVYNPSVTNNVSNNRSYTFNDFGLGVIENHSIRVVFKLPKYTITTSLYTDNKTSGGGIINQPLTNVVDSGSTTTYQITANPGFDIDSIFINKRLVFAATSLVKNYTVSINNIKGDSSLNIKFKTETYSITVSVNDTNGVKLVPNTKSITGLLYNSYQSFRINIQTGYNVDSILVDGLRVAYPAYDLYEFLYIKANHSLAVYASRGVYNINVTKGANGNVISSTGVFTVLKGNSISIIGRPNINYIVDSVWINGKLQNLSNYVGGDYIKSFNNVTGDSSIKITFKQNVVDINQTNFIVRAVNSLCPGYSNGSISITSINNRPFIVKIAGPASYTKTDTFSLTYNLNNLAPGNYFITISINGLDTNNYRVNYTIPITEPRAVSSASTVNPVNKEIELSLNGGNNYVININGKIWETQQSVVKLPLQVGMNTIIVKTDRVCQDSTIEYILVSEGVDAYPNPATNFINLSLGGTDDNAYIEIISDQGVKMFSGIRNIDNNRLVKFNIENYPNGVYIVQIKSNSILTTLKFVKSNN